MIFSATLIRNRTQAIQHTQLVWRRRHFDRHDRNDYHISPVIISHSQRRCHFAYMEYAKPIHPFNQRRRRRRRRHRRLLTRCVVAMALVCVARCVRSACLRVSVNSFCALSLSRQFRIHCFAALHQSIRIQLVVNRRPRHNTFDCCDVFLFWINKITKYPVFARYFVFFFFLVSKKRFKNTIDIQSEIIIRFSSCRVLHLYIWCLNRQSCIAGSIGCVESVDQCVVNQSRYIMWPPNI